MYDGQDQSGKDHPYLEIIGSSVIRTKFDIH